MPIVDEIESRTGRETSRAERSCREIRWAAVYIALRRLTKKELVSSTLGDPSPERGGRAKRFFRVEHAGLDMLAESRRSADTDVGRRSTRAGPTMTAKLGRTPRRRSFAERAVLHFLPADEGPEIVGDLEEARRARFPAAPGGQAGAPMLRAYG